MNACIVHGTQVRDASVGHATVHPVPECPGDASDGGDQETFKTMTALADNAGKKQYDGRNFTHYQKCRFTSPLWMPLA